MPDRSFVHLHCHTHYSLLDGASRVPELVAHVKAQGMNAVAITDHGNLYGAIEFYRECRDAGINPILGYEAYVAPRSRTDRDAKRRGDAGYHLTLLARNLQGFKNLITMSSRAFLEGYHYVPRIDWELLTAHHEGLICLSGCASSEFSEHILEDNLDGAVAIARKFHGLFGKHFYIEVQNNGLKIQRECARGAIEVANRLGLPLVATSDAHYLRQNDAASHDVLLCINTGAKRSDAKRMRYGDDGGGTIDQFYVRGPEEMYALFPDHAEAVQRSQEIANGVDIQLDFKKRHFPVFTPPAGKTPEEHLRALCAKGLLERYRGNPPQAMHERLEHELGIICRMGFASYFLIVGDFVRFAVENGIPASARGSACGALVSFVLRLSHVDPLEYDLLFERFLDPNRAEAPDIDIDFCQNRRDEVIAYVKRTYGEDSVAQIATFTTMAAKAALKDVGRVLDIPLATVNQMCNWIPKGLGVTLEDALNGSPEFKQAYDTDTSLHELVDIARTLEGTNRQAGIHAAGVVIANGPIINYVPVHRAIRKSDEGTRGGEPVVATQWVMGDLEKVGMLKMDFLGLRTLTLLKDCVERIQKTRGIKISLYDLPMDDPETYDLLQKGDGKGVFQLESEGIRQLLTQMKPDNIRDIIAIMALYRPGPLQGGMVDSYVNCKHGRETPVYVHPVMEEILSETYGVMVYQEQIMRILNKLGGIELSSAYACIKAISKKKQEIIDQRHAEFVKGALERGLSKEAIADIWNKIIVFAGYGFNKSHTAAYAQLGYQTAYLKAHFTAEFMAALLSSEIDDGNKRDILVEHIADARRLGVEVMPPDVNTSEAEFSVVRGNILFGLLAIKGLGRIASDAIVTARQQTGRFRDFFDFCERIDTKCVTRSAIEKLIKAGACDAFGRRSQLMTVLPRALQAATTLQRDRQSGQLSLFGGVEPGDGASNTPTPAETLPDVPEWPDQDKLKFEKEALDFYFSSHPLAQYDGVLSRFSQRSIADLPTLPPGVEVTIGGMLTSLRFMNTKTARNGNSRYLRCNIEDLSGAIECVMWPDDLARQKVELVDEWVGFARGSLDPRAPKEKPLLLLTRFLSLEQAQRELTKLLQITLRLGEHGPQHIERLAGILKRFPGGCPVMIDVRDGAGRWLRLKISEDYRVNPLTLSIAELEGLLGPGAVKFSGPPNASRQAAAR